MIEKDFGGVNFLTKDQYDSSNKDESELWAVETELAQVAETGDYNDLKNKPTIPTNVSELVNDSEFIDKNVSEMKNYYTKSEVDDKIKNNASITIRTWTGVE